MKKLLYFILSLSVFPSSAAIFSTLGEIQKYAADHAEYTETENNEWVNPEFTKFNKEKSPNWFTATLEKAGVFSPSWSAREFKKLLEKVTKKRELQGFIGDFVQHESPRVGDKFLIWGDLFGAFHSLVRDLEYLKSQEIIDDNLKIIKDNYFFVFNGNVINHSPYILETLTVILQLLDKNPEQVMYTRGDHEDKQRWHSFGLAQELKIRAYHISKEKIPLNTLISKFFTTLPLGFFITQSTVNVIDVVLISSNEFIDKEFSEKNYGGFFDEEGERGRHIFKLSNTKPSRKQVKLRVIIGTEDRETNYRQTKGLTLVGTRNEATFWLVFSSPTDRNRRLYEFFYDTFAQLSIEDQFKNWTITLYNQDVRELNGFQQAGVFDLVTGQKLNGAMPAYEQEIKEETPQQESKKSSDVPAKKIMSPVEKHEFTFGATMDLRKSAGPLGKRIREGLEARFDKERLEDEVPYLVPRLVVVDDQYTPQKTRAAVESFLKKGIDIFIGSQGSASLESYLDLINDGTVLVLFPYTGAPEFRKSELKNVIHYRGSYVREGEELIKYAVESLQSKKIVILYQNDAFGRGALQGALQELKKLGISQENYLEIPHQRNIVNFGSQIQKIKDFDPDTILFSTNAVAIRDLIRQMGVQYFAGKKLLGLSVYEDTFEEFLKEKGLEFILARVVPDPHESNLEIVQEYRKWADEKNIPYDKASLEMYINASILFEILKQITPPITKEKIIKVAESMKHYPLKGLVFDFNPQTRELGGLLWIDPGKGEWIVKPRELEEITQESEKSVDVQQSAVNVQQKERDTQSQIPAQSVSSIDQLKIGSAADLSKELRVMGLEVKDGLEARIKESRDAGQIVPQLFILDDEYDPEKTKGAVAQLQAKGIDILLSTVGSPTLEAILDKVKRKEILVLFPVTGAPLFREPRLKYLVNFRAPYDVEGKVLTEYAIENLNTHKAAMFYQNDSFGKGLLDAAKKILTNRGITNWVEIGYQRNQVDMSQQVEILKKEDPDTILFFSTTPAAIELIRQRGVTSIVGKKLLGNSDFSDSKFKSYAKEKGLTFVYLNVVPNPQTSTLPIVEQYRKTMNENNFHLDAFSLEAYIGMDILLMVLHKMKPPYSKETILQTIEQIKDYNYKGLKLNFDPGNRSLAQMLWIDTGSPEWELVMVN